MLSEENFVFVMLRPNFLGNIGSAARVMKNFGFEQLRLVEPPKNYLDAEARKMAVDAFDVLKKAQVYPSLAEALKDINLAVATSCGQYRSHCAENMGTLFASLIAEESGVCATNKIAIVFGDERNGMTNDEIDRCRRLMRIETSPRFPSLNLAQALGIVAYQLSVAVDSPDNKRNVAAMPQRVLMSGGEEDQLVEKVATLMDLADFSRSFSREKVQGELRTTIRRLDLSQREALLWLGFLTKIIARMPASH